MTKFFQCYHKILLDKDETIRTLKDDLDSAYILNDILNEQQSDMN